MRLRLSHQPQKRRCPLCSRLSHRPQSRRCRLCPRRSHRLQKALESLCSRLPRRLQKALESLCSRLPHRLQKARTPVWNPRRAPSGRLAAPRPVRRRRVFRRTAGCPRIVPFRSLPLPGFSSYAAETNRSEPWPVKFLEAPPVRGPEPVAAAERWMRAPGRRGSRHSCRRSCARRHQPCSGGHFDAGAGAVALE